MPSGALTDTVHTALVTGASGQVGRHLAALLRQRGVSVLCPGRWELDLANANTLDHWLAGRRFDLIAHAGAYTQVDHAENDPHTAQAVNVAATALLATHARRTGARLLTFGSDYVFTRWPHAHTPIGEHAQPCPAGVYALTKHEGEQAALALCPGALVARTSGVYDPQGVNFVAAILRRLSAEGAAQVVSDQHTLPTPAAPLAAWALGALERGAEGVLHLVPTGAPSWFDVARRIATAWENRTGKAAAITPASTQDIARPAPRPPWSVLDNSLAREAFGLELAPWEDYLDEALQEWAMA